MGVEPFESRTNAEILFKVGRSQDIVGRIQDRFDLRCKISSGSVLGAEESRSRWGVVPGKKVRVSVHSHLIKVEWLL